MRTSSTYPSFSRVPAYETPLNSSTNNNYNNIPIPDREIPITTAPRARSIRLANDVNLYFQESGTPSSPTLILLHGFPASSNYFRTLAPLLSCPHTYNFHVIAPDLPGFGATECPAGFEYTFQKLAETVVLLISALEISNFAVYCMGEYGTLVGLKVVVQFKRENTMGLIIQNGTVYSEGKFESALLDGYKSESRVVLPAAAVVDKPKTASASVSPSDTTSRRTSSSSLFSDASECKTTRNSRVSFGLVAIEQYIGRTNSVHISSTSTSQPSSSNSNDGDAEKEEPDDEEEQYEKELTLQSPPTFLDSNSSNDTSSQISTPTFTSILDNPITIDQIKALYMPSQQPPCLKLTNSTSNASRPCAVDPHAYLMDYYLLTRADQPAIQRQLYHDFQKYRKPVPLSASPINMWLRTTNTPVLVLWGSNDPLLSQAVTLENFKRDCRNCEIRVYENGGHYAAEYYPDEIALAIHEFFISRLEDSWDDSAF